MPDSRCLCDIESDVSLDIKEQTSTIVFNVMDLELNHVAIVPAASKIQILSALTFDKKMGRASVNLHTALPAGSKAQLQVGFQGQLTSSMQGYYKSGWEHEGKTKYYALTQFEVSFFSINRLSQMSNLLFIHISQLLPGGHSLAGTNLCSKRLLLLLLSLVKILST